MKIRTRLSLQLDMRDSRLLLGAQRLVMDAFTLRAEEKRNWSCSPSHRVLAAVRVSTPKLSSVPSVC